MNKRHPGAEHTVRAVCADFMALGNHGLVFGGGSEPAASHREAAAAPYNDTFFGAVPALQAAVCTCLTACADYLTVMPPTMPYQS